MSNRNDSGFTLIEVLIVLGGAAIISLFLPAVQTERNPNVECVEAPPNPICEMQVGPPESRE